MIMAAKRDGMNYLASFPVGVGIIGITTWAGNPLIATTYVNSQNVFISHQKEISHDFSVIRQKNLTKMYYCIIIVIQYGC